jgi:hypothetical protein
VLGIEYQPKTLPDSVSFPHELGVVRGDRVRVGEGDTVRVVQVYG